MLVKTSSLHKSLNKFCVPIVGGGRGEGGLNKAGTKEESYLGGRKVGLSKAEKKIGKQKVREVAMTRLSTIRFSELLRRF